MSPLFTLTNDFVIGSAPAERAGAASVMSETCGELGGALGIAVFGSLGIAVYRSAMPEAVQGVSLEVMAAARGTLGGAAAVAGQLPAELGAQLMDEARLAFTNGLQLAAIISAVGSVALAVYTLVALRHARSGGGAKSEAESRKGPSRSRRRSRSALAARLHRGSRSSRRGRCVLGGALLEVLLQ
jgi:MFS transporter, DHA2 family, multidrug resistance protein